MQPSNNGSEHELKIKELGSIKLSVAFQSDDTQNNNNSNSIKNVTVFSFLRKMLTDSEKIFNVRNELTDEDIKNIVKYIANLEDSDVTNRYYEKDDKIYHFLPTSLDFIQVRFGERSIVSEKRAFELKKESLILGLILCGVNPLRIKECLQSKNNENEFNGLSWNKICEGAVCFKKEIGDAQAQYKQLRGECPLYDESKFDVPLLFLNYMYLIEICKNPSGNEQTLTLCYENISNSKYISCVYDGYMAPFFLIKYLYYVVNNQNDDKQATRLSEINRVFVECLLNDKTDGYDSLWYAKKKLQKQSGKNQNLEPILDIYIYKFYGFYKFLIPKFWDIIDNLPEECIFVFVAEMMREVTLTREQLNVVNEKITNMSLRLYLEKLNYDLNRKKDQVGFTKKKLRMGCKSMQPSNNGSEHELKIKELGSIKLSVAFQSDDTQNNNNSNSIKNVTVFSFLRKMLTDSEKIFNVRNELTDEDIKNIVKYIANLEASDITDQYHKKRDKIYHFLPTSLDHNHNQKRIVSEKRALELKKESLILGLILCGINPLRIKECLQSKNNENEFNGLSWNKICKDAVCFKKEIEDAQAQYDQLKEREFSYYRQSIWDVPLLFLNYMYLIEICKNPSGNEQTLTLCYENISNSEYIGSVYDGYMAPFFLIKYLHYAVNNQNDNKQATRLLEINRVFVECLLNDKIIGYDSPHAAKEKLQKQSGKNQNLEPILDIYIYKFYGFYKFLIPKFWDIIDNLPEECIFVFVAEMMREVTLTREQLNVVNEKITNMSLRLYLEKLNYDLNHKKDQESIINKGTKIFWANYLCEKLFRGIGWLPGVVLVAFLFALEIFFVIVFDYWLITAFCFAGAFVIVRFLVIEYMIVDKNNVFKKCVDFMQQAYDKTLGYLMKVWALHYPVNNIPPINTAIQIMSIQGNYYSTSENFRQNNITETESSSIPTQSKNDLNTSK